MTSTVRQSTRCETGVNMRGTLAALCVRTRHAAVEGVRIRLNEFNLERIHNGT